MPEPITLEYAERSVRAYRDWTPALLRAAEIQADGGNLRLAADLFESMIGDDRVKGVFDTRTDELLGRTLTFEASGGRRRDAAVKALEADEDWWEAFHGQEVKKLHAWGIGLGVGLGELVWEERVRPRNQKRVLPRLKVWNPRELRWDPTSRRWMLGVDGDREIPITPGDGKWVLYTPYGASRPWVYGAYRALARWVLLKLYAVQDWGFYSERHGQGILVAKNAEGSHEQRKEVAADLQSLGRNAAIALPKGFELDLVESEAATWETFKAQIEIADNGFAVAVLGQNLTTQVGQGSHAAATVHGRVALGRTKADAETLSQTIRDQALTWWAEFNFGDSQLAPWPTWDTTPTEDLKERAATLQMVAQAVQTLVNAGAPLDVRALLETFKLPIVDSVSEEKGTIFKYHLDYAIVTKNEVRGRLGLAPMKDGDVPPTLVAPPGGDGQNDGDEDAA